MSSMTKKLPLFVSLISALSLAFVTVHQTGVINDLKDELKMTLNRLTKTQKLLEHEMVTNEQLRQEIHVLVDSIEVMHDEISTLNAKIADQKETIRSQNLKVQKMHDEVKGLTSQINKLRDENNSQAKQITSLEAKRDELLKKIEIIDRNRQELKSTLAEQEEVVAESSGKVESMEQAVANNRRKLEMSASQNAGTPMMSGQHEKMSRIVTNTSVQLTDVKLRNREKGKNFDRVDNKKWRYVILDFNLSNMDQEAITDEDFIIQLYDIDAKKVVPFNESNPGFPESDQGAIGFRFTYKGGPVSISYFNSQEKNGKNYEVRFYYTKNSFVIPLKNGTRQIVKDGRVIAG